MFSPPLNLSESPIIQPDGSLTAPRRKFRPAAFDSASIGSGIKRRWLRERRRRKVARAYDMALEIARVIPRGSQVLDVGCGNGFIAHHLSAMMGTGVVGIDVADSTDAPIDYRRYNGLEFPVPEGSIDAVVLAYVLHHAQDLPAVLSETRRVLRPGGVAVIYEDIPEAFWDQFICWTHDRQWRKRTGQCTFRNEAEWRHVFERAGFAVIRERPLARLRNLTHPVRRRFFLLRLQADTEGKYEPRTTHTTNVSPLRVSLASVERDNFQRHVASVNASGAV
jgi:ubiquinone/menaquinone biosynthesis C-methylase UbiE